MIQVLANIFEQGKTNIESSSKVKIVAEFLKAQIVQVYDLEGETFFDSSIPEYRLARFTFYQLLRKYTLISHQMIGKHYQQHGMNKRKALYACAECDKRLAESSYVSPQDKLFRSRYNTVEAALIQFLTKINTNLINP